MVPLERHLYGHSLAGGTWERRLDEVFVQEDLEKVPSWECLYFHRQAQVFLSENVDDEKHDWTNSSAWPLWG